MELDNFRYSLLNLKKCNQFWDDMKPVPGGRHCKGCSKTIVDFSSMTYSEIALFMSESKNPVCGFYSPDQLSGRYNQISSLPLKIGLSTLLTTAFVSHGYSRIKPDTIETTFNSSKLSRSKTQETVINLNNDTLIIKGKVQSFDT